MMTVLRKFFAYSANESKLYVYRNEGGWNKKLFLKCPILQGLGLLMGVFWIIPGRFKFLFKFFLRNL